MGIRVLKIFGILIVTLIALYIVWWNLPVKYNRASDISFGNQLIDNIERYRQENDSLPMPDDWETLRTLGFKFDFEVVTPAYQRINDSTYELIYIEGFDGPYLLWNSQEKKWKMDQMTIPDRFKD